MYELVAQTDILQEDLENMQEANVTARKKTVREIVHSDISRRLQVGREFKRAGTIIKAKPLESIPCIQIPASTIDEDIAKTKRKRLYDAIYSKNLMKKKKQKQMNNKLQSLRKDMMLHKGIHS